MPDLSEYIIQPKHASQCACTLCACMHRPISQPNWIRSEISKYLWNQDNMLDLSEHISQPEHASYCACILCACMHRPISQPNWVRPDISKYLWNQEIMMDLSEHIHHPSMQASVHAPYVLACTGPYLSQIGSDQRDQSIYGIRRTCRTSLST